ncbi:MBL fold metallo-hydrolase [Actinomarinicola tropica]|uniref:MBL fold metallo-hydrolase n=1 Tax=Actinomarinicola tropica TaxID=2789776 RepID=A0A5Q2RJS7_9ACTN|nr:MBL fold metallo-hydrolase [Actinomarinicola tropica]QGG94297.1 MBL fold metallo-hydrolase [Actinomarinicola tropica]
MVDVHVIETPGLGDRSYVATDGDVAVVVDPQRDVDRVLDVVGDARITHVFETHVHNDYVTGGFALARRTGAAYVLNADDEVAFERTPIRDGETVTSGSMAITAVSTPGHTPTHLSYVLSVDDHPIAVFTGGSMLFGAVGRTDLIDPAIAEELTRQQFRSARRLAASLPDDTEVFPTHGFGSFCSATETKGDASTIGKEKQQNNALTSDEDDFVDELLSGLTAYPRYYAHMGPLNLEGPSGPDLSLPALVDPVVLRARIDAGEWVVDLRARRAFAAGHAPGTISVELADPFATHLGWAIPWGTPLTLVGDDEDQVLEARRHLVRIGIDQLAGASVDAPEVLSPDGRPASYRRATFADLADELPRRGDDIAVLDVRRPDEWTDGHIAGATLIPFWELEHRMDEVPAGEVWVHCQSGYRASIGASLVDRAGGRTVVHIDDEWDAVADTDLPVDRGHGHD